MASNAFTNPVPCGMGRLPVARTYTPFSTPPKKSGIQAQHTMPKAWRKTPLPPKARTTRCKMPDWITQPSSTQISAITAPVTIAAGEALRATMLSICSGEMPGVPASSFCICAAIFSCWESVVATVKNTVPLSIKSTGRPRPALPPVCWKVFPGRRITPHRTCQHFSLSSCSACVCSVRVVSATSQSSPFIQLLSLSFHCAGNHPDKHLLQSLRPPVLPFRFR